MKLNLLMILCIVLISNSIYSQKTTKLILDLNVKSKSLKNINTTDNPTTYSVDSVYQTTFKAKNLVEDTVAFNHLDNNILKKDFMCNHYYENDTLIIKGGFGLRYQMYGFVAKIFPNKKAQVKLKLNWVYPSYYNSLEETNAKSEILVDTKYSKIILNKVPKNKTDKSHIYGYVEFISSDYFVEMKDKKTKIPYKEKK